VVTTTTAKIAAVMLVIAVTGVAAGAWHTRRGALLRLVTEAERVDEVLDKWHADRAAILAELPSAHYRTSQIDRQAADRLRRATLAAETSLGGATQRLRRIRVTEPFNGVVAVARDSYLHYVRRWSGYLMRIADDPVAGIDVPPPAFAVSRAAAAAAFRVATPPLAGTELRQRAAALFTHEPRRSR